VYAENASDLPGSLPEPVLEWIAVVKMTLPTAVIVQTAIVQPVAAIVQPVAEQVPQAVAVTPEAAEELKTRFAAVDLWCRTVKPAWKVVAPVPVAGTEQFVAAAVPGWSVRLPALQELYSVKAPGFRELLPEPAQERVAVVKTVQPVAVSVPEAAAVLPAEELNIRVVAAALQRRTMKPILTVAVPVPEIAAVLLPVEELKTRVEAERLAPPAAPQ
jgi:hypothetical protein